MMILLYFLGFGLVDGGDDEAMMKQMIVRDGARVCSCWVWNAMTVQPTSFLPSSRSHLRPFALEGDDQRGVGWRSSERLEFRS
mmetsp:Transcript_29341/g.43266  ORF Transcript_29341/g.43266 Transcript_29341/m.43266 type:complete len:83 (-) Transcript_29341:15-263(-)